MTMLVPTILYFLFFLALSLYETIKTFSKIYVLMSYKFRMLKCVSCCLQFSKKSHKRGKLRACYSADGDGRGIIPWCTCLRWGLHKVSRQVTLFVLSQGGIYSYWPGGSSVRSFHTNASFSCSMVTVFIRALVLTQKSCWGRGFSLLVGVLPVSLKPQSDFHRTWICREFNVAEMLP